jgi:hypothetical protein
MQPSVEFFPSLYYITLLACESLVLVLLCVVIRRTRLYCIGLLAFGSFLTVIGAVITLWMRWDRPFWTAHFSPSEMVRFHDGFLLVQTINVVISTVGFVLLLVWLLRTQGVNRATT